MSLSGLDSSAVETAVRALGHERGAWFLVHYTSRDTVDVLAQGTKGINELREAADKYYNGPDADGSHKPLFGMIDFRRRKMLLKLVPEETTRLVKARVQVHWASVTSRFPNHESVFETTSIDQLTESGLTAHVELHSGGRSSSGSNKKPVLDGISEEGTEDRPSPLQSGKSSVMGKTDEVQQVSPLASSVDSVDHSKRISALIDNAAATSAALQRSLASPPELAPVPEVSVTGTSPTTHLSDDWTHDNRRPSTDARSMLDLSDRRLSTQSGRPSTANEAKSLYEFESLYKPKVKLGPRPATASRPISKAAGSAALPSGLRVSRPSSIRPKSRDSTHSNHSTHSTFSAYKIPPPPPIPETTPIDFTPRPRSSGQSVKSLPATLPKSPGMTREKQRLMKFREMYKEKDKRSKEKASDAEIKEPEAISLAANTDKPTFPAPASDPTEDSTQRLSSISETSTVTRPTSQMPEALASDRTISPTDDMKQTSTTGPSMGAETSSSVGASTEVDQTETLPLAEKCDVPRPSGESISTLPASSPTSFMASSELTSSTRATSVADDSDHEKTPEATKTRLNATSNAEEDTDDEESESSTPTAAPLAGARRSMPDEKEKRRAAVAPLTIPSDANDNDATLTDGEHSFDDDLMDELDGAEVQEAFSVSVSKSPITPFFQRRPSGMMTPGSSTSMILNGTASPIPLPSSPNSSDRKQKAAITAVDHTNSSYSTQGATFSEQSSSVDGGATVEHGQAGEASAEQTVEASFSHGPEEIPSIQTEVSSATHQHVNGNQVHKDSQSPSINVQLSDENPNQPATTTRTPSDPHLMVRHDHSPSGSPSQSPLLRGFSGPLLSAVPQDDNVSVHKRRNLGSGVAAKIADLQRNFSRSTSSGNPVRPTSRKSSAVSTRAVSSGNDGRDVTPPRSAHSHFRDEHLFRGRAMSKGSIRSFDSRDTRTSTPDRNKSSGSIGKLDSKRISTFNNPAIEVSSKPDTIQVKATIVRADGHAQDGLGLGLHNAPTDSQRSKVTPEPHYAHPRTSVIVEEPRSPTRTSMEKKHRRARSSISSALGLIGIRSGSPQRPAEHPASPGLSIDGRRSAHTSMDMSGSLRSLRRRASASLSRSPSISRARSPSTNGRRSPLPTSPMLNGNGNASAPRFSRSMSSSSLESTATEEAEGSHKRKSSKGSRASRMLKRMSNSMNSMLNGSTAGTGADRQSAAVPTVEEEKWPGTDIGEMNVQFPDTLLWKRRYLEIDTQGYLVLKPNDTATIHKNISSDKKLERKYHLSQFFPPFAPDMERMEMPYSVVLDFKEDGSTLQIAADSGLGQSGVLRGE